MKKYWQEEKKKYSHSRKRYLGPVKIDEILSLLKPDSPTHCGPEQKKTGNKSNHSLFYERGSEQSEQTSERSRAQKQSK